jgi:RimJ/RimL family protein N-acetyltransferase
MPELQFFDDPRAFLDVAEEHLSADPVLNTVVSTVTHRAAEDGLSVGEDPRWWVTVSEAGRVVGVAMRTAPAPPHPLFVLPMPEEGAVALARALHERGEPVAAINGALPAALLVAEETARLAGGEATVDESTRLHLLGDLVEPVEVPGRLRPAVPADVDLALAWFAAFEQDAAEQAGREAAHGPLEPQDEPMMLARIDQRRLWFWEDADGRRVHLTGATPPVFGVARVGPVYTPKDQRGRGYASAAVAAVSRLLLDHDAQVCLFTDQANPSSNKIYEALGYRPVVDMANLVIR